MDNNAFFLLILPPWSCIHFLHRWLLLLQIWRNDLLMLRMPLMFFLPNLWRCRTIPMHSNIISHHQCDYSISCCQKFYLFPTIPCGVWGSNHHFDLIIVRPPSIAAIEPQNVHRVIYDNLWDYSIVIVNVRDNLRFPYQS